MLASRQRITKALLFAFALVNLAVGTSRATLLSPGGVVLALPAFEPMGAKAIADITLPFSTPTYSGTLRSTVWLGDTSNPLGGLTFSYILTNDAASTDSIRRLGVLGFGNFATDVNWSLFLAGKAPTLADRTPGGAVVAFDFVGPLVIDDRTIGAGPLDPGEKSRAMIVQTNARNFHLSLAGTLDDHLAIVGTFAPIGRIIPEPSSLMLASLGALGFVWTLRRARRKR
jgi:hypothetical protein